jgi:predicted O-methyltransferase YrrM
MIRKLWIPVTLLAAALLVAPGVRCEPAAAAPEVDTPPVERAPLAKTDAEKRILEILDDMHRNQRRGMMNISVEDGRLLRLLTESMGARHVVEIGTSNGYSGIWFCLGLRTTGGKLTTYEIDEGRAALARENFARAKVEPMVTLVEGDAHEEVTRLEGPIDLLFLDADKSGYVDYLTKLLPQVRPGGLVVAHNMVRPDPDPAYLDAVTTNPDLVESDRLCPFRPKYEEHGQSQVR